MSRSVYQLIIGLILAVIGLFSSAEWLIWFGCVYGLYLPILIGLVYIDAMGEDLIYSLIDYLSKKW